MRNEYDDLKIAIGKAIDEAFKLFDDQDDMKDYISSAIMCEVYKNFRAMPDVVKIIDSMMGGRNEKDI